MQKVKILQEFEKCSKRPKMFQNSRNVENSWKCWKMLLRSKNVPNFEKCAKFRKMLQISKKCCKIRNVKVEKCCTNRQMLRIFQKTEKWYKVLKNVSEVEKCCKLLKNFNSWKILQKSKNVKEIETFCEMLKKEEMFKKVDKCWKNRRMCQTFWKIWKMLHDVKKANIKKLAKTKATIADYKLHCLLEQIISNL